jgi:hypothetical protein
VNGAAKLAIQNTHGQWWTGSCWGVEQARETFDGGWQSLPMFLDDDTADELILEVHAEAPLDARYYPTDAVVEHREVDAEASVHEVTT